ncbi:winged helix-turn-helix domain-containing protein [Enterococcus sp. AZ163]|uniref:winged helix-turn-helix domain-containing protein n=1 Tax=Enterococcus sp. AZ163 TaxID=2774638 RepID=UPI003D289CF0
MKHVLILTKNPLTEEAIVNKLQRMNCEILCSTDLLNHLQKGTINPFVFYFRWVILSESLCHTEVEQLLNLLQNQPLTVLRVVENFPNEEEQNYWNELGLADWLHKDIGYEDLREKVNELLQQQQQKEFADQQILSFPYAEEQTEPTEWKLLWKSLSKTEKKVFESLINAYTKTEALSRKELCDQLWSDGDTASNMSQLSCLINKLKRKFEQHGLTGETITTLWGRGYRFSDELYEYWLKGAQQQENLKYAMN